MFEVREIENDRAKICEAVLRSLPLWFGIESSIKDYVRDAQTMPMLVAFQNDSAVGFVSLKRHSPLHRELFVMGVLPEFHGQGAGRALVESAEDFARANGSSYLTVKTVSAKSDNREYARTRGFYEAMGFAPFEEHPNLWGSHNPCLVMIKPIRLPHSPA